MGVFRRSRRQDPVPLEPSGPSPALLAVVERVARDCAAIAPGDGPPSSATSSYAGGHPYLPDERPWPTWGGVPMVFLVQVNLAELPPLDGFPGQGLLQWFVGADDTYGLTFDETMGTVGFEVRWYDDLARPSLRAPTFPTPWHEAGADAHAPIEVTDATRLDGSAVRMLPRFEELPDGIDLAPLAEFAVAVGEDPDDLAFVWNEYVRGESSSLDLGPRSNVGGFADFTQEDPRGNGAFPAAGSPEGRLLVMLDSQQFGGWGDAGVGVLFGDPVAVGRGDLSSVRWSWDCS